MKASRLLSIMMMLQARGRMTAPALAEALEVSERTILRDIDQLSNAGVPIWGDRGRKGGFQLREGWSTDLTGLTEAEAHALFLAGLPGPATDLGLHDTARSARLKVIASLPAESRERADRVASRLHVDTVDWYRANETPVFLREVADAVWSSYRIEVTYESWRGSSRRELEPLGLVLKGGTWYLIARIVGKPEPLTFRLSNILELESSRRRFKRPARFDLAKHWRDALGRHEAGLHRLTAHIAVSPRGEKWLANDRVKTMPLLQEVRGADTPRGWKQLLVPIESIEQGTRKLLGYGSEVKIVGPLALRNKFLDELARLKMLYARRIRPKEVLMRQPSRTSLFAAAKAWDHAAVAAMLAAAPELIHACDPKGRTALHLACSVKPGAAELAESHGLKTVATLLDAGGDLEGVVPMDEDEGDFRATPLWYAVARGENVPLVEYLVKRGANTSFSLWAVVWRDDEKMCRILLKAKPELNLRAHGETPIFYAARLQRLKTLELLIKAGADASIADDKGRDAVEIARARGLPEAVVERLMRVGKGGSI